MNLWTNMAVEAVPATVRFCMACHMRVSFFKFPIGTHAASIMFLLTRKKKKQITFLLATLDA